MGEIGLRIGKVVRDKNIKINDLAEELGVARSTVDAWVNGKCNPKIDKIAKLVDILGVKADYIVKG